MNQTKNGWKKKIRKMAKRCVWCAQVEKVSKNSSKESEYLFREQARVKNPCLFISQEW